MPDISTNHPFWMVQHGSTWFNMVQHGSTWFNMVQQTIPIVYYNGDCDCYMVITVINGWLLNLIDYLWKHIRCLMC